MTPNNVRTDTLLTAVIGIDILEPRAARLAACLHQQQQQQE